jgi:hypothetical protein
MCPCNLRPWFAVIWCTTRAEATNSRDRVSALERLVDGQGYRAVVLRLQHP